MKDFETKRVFTKTEMINEWDVFFLLMEAPLKHFLFMLWGYIVIILPNQQILRLMWI